MSIMIACPTRGRVWYETAMSLTELSEDERVGDVLYVQNKISVLEARNDIVRAFLQTEHEFLLMVDDDVVPPPDVADLVAHLQESPAAGIIGAPCPLLRPGLPVLPNIYVVDPETEYAAIDLKMSIAERPERLVEVDAVGFGCVMLRRELVQMQPTFQTRDKLDGELWMGEDVDYCLRASENGFTTYVDTDLLCEHMVEIHAGGLAATFLKFLDPRPS